MWKARDSYGLSFCGRSGKKVGRFRTQRAKLLRTGQSRRRNSCRKDLEDSGGSRKADTAKQTHGCTEITFGGLESRKSRKAPWGVYHKVQIELTYNSNHIEGSRLTHDQTRYIFETNTIGITDAAVKVDDVVETANHFKCIDMIVDNAAYPPSEAFIKQLHAVLKSGTTDSRQDWFAVGEYKRFPNEVGGMDTTAPEKVAAEMKKLLAEYSTIKKKSFDDLLNFH